MSEVMPLRTFVLVFMCLVTKSYCQLVVNVKNNGGDVYRENIEANTTQDTIVLEFRKADGTMVTHFIDGRNEVQIFRVVILPEEELGQTHIQTMCFVLRFAKNEFISSDAMSKLRQKNPSTVRHPEESRPLETYELDLLLNVGASHVVSAHISEICKDATLMTYSRDSDLHLLSQILNRDYSILQSVTEPAPVVNLSSCSDILYESSSSSSPCVCHYDICIGWYPCGLKYCRGKDSAGRIVSYRCGIKTCSRCRRFEFRVASKGLCVWDEPEFQLANWQSEADSAAAAPQDAGEDGNPNINAEGVVADGGPVAEANGSIPKPNKDALQPAEANALKPANVQRNEELLHDVKANHKVQIDEGAGNQVNLVQNFRLAEGGGVQQNAKSLGNAPRNVPDDDEDGE